MNWFERHLNWSLFLGLIYIPMNISLTVGLILSIILIIIGLISYGFGSELVQYLAGMEGTLGETTSIVLGIIVLLLVLIAIIRFGFWFLDRKGRNRAFVLCLVAPPFVGFAVMFFIGMILGYIGIIAGLVVAILGPIVGLIILLLLVNQGIGYGVDLGEELLTERWPDTGQFGATDDRQFKELDYTPAKNVLDIVDSPDTKSIGAAKDMADRGDVNVAGIAGAAIEEAPAQEKVVERAVSQERLKMPILLDDAGAPITCFYHPGADAVNLCSRCRQYVCSECNYLTGTNPICRNCWRKRAEIPMAPPAQKQVSPVGNPEKQKVVEQVKSAKLDAEKSEWQPEFVALYEQASPIINVVTRKGADGMPASPLDLMEGLKLRPMLERVKKLSKPKERELREAKDDFEQILSSCIKIADAAANFISSGGQALLGGKDFARIVQGIETANGLMEKLSLRLASFSQPQE